MIDTNQLHLSSTYHQLFINDSSSSMPIELQKIIFLKPGIPTSVFGGCSRKLILNLEAEGFFQGQSLTKQ